MQLNQTAPHSMRTVALLLLMALTLSAICWALSCSPTSAAPQRCMQASGRAAVAVAWGPWGGAGMAAANASLTARLTRQGDGQQIWWMHFT